MPKPALAVISAERCATSAVKEGDDYILNGSKTFNYQWQHADMVISGRKTDPVRRCQGPSPVSGDNQRLEKFMALVANRGQDWASMPVIPSDLFFADMRVPASALFGEAGKGFVLF